MSYDEVREKMHEKLKKAVTYSDCSLIELFAELYGFESELEQFRAFLRDLIRGGEIYTIEEAYLYNYAKYPLGHTIYTNDKSLLVNCSGCDNYFALELLRYKDENTFYCPDCRKSKMKKKVLDKISEKLDSSTLDDLKKEYNNLKKEEV